MTYWTADTHFGHKAILEHCPERAEAFGDLHTMNKILIDNINAIVGRNDTLRHLGDFCWQASRAGSYRQMINCRKIHVVRGNHDAASLRTHVSSLELMIFLKNPAIHACHWPIESWGAIHYDGIHAHGHCHGRLRKLKNRVDVGVDSIFKLLGEWRPISEDELLELAL